MSSSSSSSKPENGKKTLILDTDIIKMRESTAFTQTPAATQVKADLETATRYVITDTRRHKFNFCIGAFTVFLVVAFIALLQSSIARSPIIFLKLAEDEVGEFDLLMVPKPTASSTLGVPTVQTSLFNQSNVVQQEEASISSGFLLNFTEIQRRTANVDELVGVAPRWLALSRVTKIDNHLINSTAIVLVIDSVQEAKIQFVCRGRVWSHRALGRDETHVASVVLRRLGVKANAGENITMVIDLLDLAGQVGGLDVTSAETLLGRFVGEGVVQTLANVSIAGVLDQINNATGQEFTLDAVEAYLATAFGITRPPSIDPNQSLTSIMFDFVKEALTIRRNLTVIDGVDSPDGKYPKALGNVMLLEKEHVHDIIAQPLYNAANALRSLQKNLQENLSLLPLELALETALNVSTPVLQTAIQQFIDGIEAAEQFELDHYALSVAGMYRDRLDSYVGTRTEIQHDMIHFTNAVVDGLGYDAPVEMQTTLATSLGALYFIRLFLDQIFNFSSIVLIGLGSLLIYSLLLSNVEEKTFEYGMLRAQGMRQYVLIELLCIQSLWFSIPGIAAGLFAAWLLYIPIAILINVYVNVPIDLSLDGLAIGIAVLVGLCMPVIANIVPISQALSSTLRNALDVYHQSEGEVTVTTVELSKVGLAPWQVMLSTLMIVMGFVVYYMMPYSFIFNNIPLFLFLLTLILLGMLVGLSMVAQILQSPLEKGVSWLFMWGSERRRLRPLVLKALYAHGRRNRKTAVMFTTALAFIIFTGTSFALQGHSIADNVELGVGADLVVLAPSTNFPVNKDAMASYLDLEMERRKQGAKDAHVLGYAYETYPLSNYDFIRSTSISNMAGYPSLRCRVVGMAEKYVDETYTKFYNPSESAEGFDFKESRNGEPDVIDALYSNAGKLKLPLEQAKGSRIPPNVISTDVAGLDEERGSPETGYPIVRSNEESYNNYIDVVVSESVRLQGAIDTETPLLLGISYKESVVNTTYIAFFAKAQGMIAKMAGDLSYSSYRQLASLSKVAVSIPQYERLLTTLRNSSSVAQELGVQGVSTGATAPPKAGTGGKGKPPQIQKLYVRLSEEATELEREAIVNALRNFIRDDITQVLDARTLVASTATAISLLQYFFIVVTAIAVTMCFFVLWLSFTANIRENAWEFGVLRAIGLSSSQVMRVYVYEAACLITASLLLGTLIGMAQAMTLTLQFNLFTELPFTFDFPWTLFALVVVLSFVVAIAGSYYPAREYRDKQISSVIKGK